MAWYNCGHGIARTAALTAVEFHDLIMCDSFSNAIAPICYFQEVPVPVFFLGSSLPSKRNHNGDHLHAPIL